jgi:hypothetical protein
MFRHVHKPVAEQRYGRHKKVVDVQQCLCVGEPEAAIFGKGNEGLPAISANYAL